MCLVRSEEKALSPCLLCLREKTCANNLQMAKSILVIGYGNSGRLDDGLGPALALAVEGFCLPHVTVEIKHQLTVEDAETVSQHEFVIFADASVNCSEPYEIKEIDASPGNRFSSHEMSPEGILAIASELFDSRPTGWMLSIRGYNFDEFGEELSKLAQDNLKAARNFLHNML